MPRRPLRALPIVVVSAGMLALAACTPTGSSTATPSAGSTAGSTASTPADSPVPTPTTGGTSGPATTARPSASATSAHAAVDRSCAQLVSAQTVYDYNANFVAVAATASSGSGAAAALAANGVACAWQNTTSGETIVLGVARYSPAELAALKAKAAGTAVSGWGDAGWFSRSGSTGTASFAVGDAWATLASTTFFASDDAAPLVQSAAAGLR